jgi:ATP synthase F subunit
VGGGREQIAEDIRFLLDAHTEAIPAVLEIPSKEHPYDSSKDSILRRARVRRFFMFTFGCVLVRCVV